MKSCDKTIEDLAGLIHPDPLSMLKSDWREILMKEIKEHDPVNHPSHYTSHPSGVECIQITRHMNFNRGNAIKYIWRCGDKGKPIEDLEKAIFYLKDEIKRINENNSV